jgi:hypothetical protein
MRRRVIVQKSADLFHISVGRTLRMSGAILHFPVCLIYLIFLHIFPSRSSFTCLRKPATYFLTIRCNSNLGRAMAQAVSRRPATAEARFRSRVSPCGICGGQSGTGAGISPSTSVFPCQFHSSGVPLLGNGQKIIIIFIFIIGLHKKPQGCGASVASAAGPFTTKKKTVTSSTQI